MEKNKWLIAIDFDKTFLIDSYKYPNIDFNKNDVDVLKQLIQKGHKVAFVTGRSWSTTKKLYKNIGIKSALVNYNGAYITEKQNKEFVSFKKTIRNNEIIEVANFIENKKFLVNIILEYKNTVSIFDLNDYILKEYKNSNYRKIKKLNLNKLSKNEPLGVYFRIKTNLTEKEKLLNELENKFGKSYLFWFWSKIVDNVSNLEMCNINIDKGFGVEYVASQYNIPMSNTIAFGDNLNDINMLSKVKYGVAMKNGKNIVKEKAKYVTKYTNNESGVTKYLTDFFKLN